MGKTTRRSFLKHSAVAGLAASSWTRAFGANDAIRVAVVGFNGRGKSHINAFEKMEGVRLVALCDADRDVLDKQAKRLQDAGKPVECYTDVRKVIENKNIDAIATATPNHWHSLLTIWACQGGKDVYVEKPVSHNVWEGRKMVEAAEVRPDSPDRHSEPLEYGSARGAGLGEGWQSRQDQDRARPLLQAAGQHRQGRWATNDSRIGRL